MVFQFCPLCGAPEIIDSIDEDINRGYEILLCRKCNARWFHKFGWMKTKYLKLVDIGENKNAAQFLNKKLTLSEWEKIRDKK
jgi:formate dehydrogenase maturation protein FdhE